MQRLALSTTAFLVACAAAAFAHAQSPPQATQDIAVGASIRAADGGSLGRVQAVTRDARGHVVQVKVRSRGLPGTRPQTRTLPASSLRATSGGYQVPLRREEFDLLPPAKD